MLTSRMRHARRRAVASTVLGLLLVGTAASPAWADSVRDRQWHLDAMKAEQMWKTSTGKGMTVAVIDSGVDWTNGDLKGQVLPGKDYALADPGDQHTDLDGHGTAMAGLIAGTGKSGGGDGAFGLAPGAKILPLRVPSDDRTISKAIRYAADSRVKIINISIGGDSGDQQLTSAVAYALKKGSLIFAAAGNSAKMGNPVEYPAATPGVVAVAAVGKDLHRTAESEHGPQVDMAAPGDQIVQACTGKTGICIGHGTSAATALASASAALIWSVHPHWTNNQILRVMLNTIGGPTDGKKRNDSIGYGIVRPRIALRNPGDPGPADTYPLPDLAAAASASPTPSTGANPPATRPKTDHRGAEASTSHGDGGTSILWLTLAAVAGLAAAIGVTAAVRRRRSALGA
jgi:type VII secretion-associated serine protease mycosin